MIRIGKYGSFSPTCTPDMVLLTLKKFSLFTLTGIPIKRRQSFNEQYKPNNTKHSYQT
jgi:hypothetical protein